MRYALVNGKYICTANADGSIPLNSKIKVVLSEVYSEDTVRDLLDLLHRANTQEALLEALTYIAGLSDHHVIGLDGTGKHLSNCPTCMAQTAVDKEKEARP